MTRGLVFSLLMAPAPERLALKTSNGIPELLVVLQFVLERPFEPFYCALTPVVINRMWIAEPSPLPNWGVEHVPSARTTPDIHVRIISLTMPHGRF
jgi:hypothetical protein